MITMVRQDAGHTAVTASNGAKAFEVLASERAEVVLMHIMMPVLDGREAFARLRANPEVAARLARADGSAADPLPRA